MAGKKKYLLFCQEAGTAPLPATEQKLIEFVAFAANQGLKHQTIKCYLSAVRHLQIASGGGDPRVENMPVLELILRGARKEQSGDPKRTRLPITPSILEQLRRVWNRDPSEWDHVMLWAACCVGFFGFLRSGELTAPEKEKFDPKQHLTVKDIALDNQTAPPNYLNQDKTVENRPFSSRGDNLLGKNKLRGLPGGCIVILPGITWQGRGSTVSVQGWESTDTPPPGIRAEEGSSRGWAEARELCRAQL